MRKFNGIAVLSGGGGGGGGVVALSRGGVVADTAGLLQTFVAEGPPGACYKPGKKTHSHLSGRRKPDESLLLRAKRERAYKQRMLQVMLRSFLAGAEWREGCCASGIGRSADRSPREGAGKRHNVRRTGHRPQPDESTHRSAISCRGELDRRKRRPGREGSR